MYIYNCTSTYSLSSYHTSRPVIWISIGITGLRNITLKAITIEVVQELILKINPVHRLINVMTHHLYDRDFVHLNILINSYAIVH